MKYYIYGAGGHGKVVLDAMQQSGLLCDGFVDDRSIDQWVTIPVFSSALLNQQTDICVQLAIGNCAIRQKITDGLIGVQFFSVQHPSAILSLSADIGIGSFLAAGAIIGPDVKVGKHCIINHQAIVDHDCSVGNFCHIAPHASLGGGVKVGEGVLIGAGAVILPNITIGDYATVGAGSIVINDIASGMTVLGNPARVV